jgi:hypothetical protein
MHPILKYKRKSLIFFVCGKVSNYAAMFTQRFHNNNKG